MGFFSFFSKEKKETLDKGLSKTKESVFSKIARAVAGKSKVDDEVLDNLEEVLITSDVGVETTLNIIKRIEERVARDKYVSTSELNEVLRDEIASLLAENNSDDNDNWDLPSSHSPYVILVVGVNGVGKTTTIGKLASRLKNSGKKVVLGAADTFRAAAIDQLDVWAQRAGVDIVKHKEGADPAAVIFDTISAAKARGTEIIICDTAGRLHNKKNLMEELAKIYRVIDRELPYSDREVLLVLDATTGQNAVNQAREFAKIAEITGIILTKLDGTARGGVVLSIKNDLKVPVKFIGVGEGIDDLQPFNPKAFAEGLFEALPEDYEEDDIDLSKIREDIVPSDENAETSELAQAMGEVFRAMAEIQAEETEEVQQEETEETPEESVESAEETVEEVVEEIAETTEEVIEEKTEEVVEEVAQEVEEEPVKEEPKKKKGFFGRLFG